MTDAQLDEYCKPYLQVQTKAIVEEDEDDETIDLNEAADKKERKKQNKEDLRKSMIELALQHGIDVSQFNLPKGLK
jgi:hypothetical protein